MLSLKRRVARCGTYGNFQPCPQHFASKDEGGTHPSVMKEPSKPLRNNGRGIA